MALVVVSHGSAASFLHGQPWLGPLQGLNLALLVHAKDDGLVRRVEVQPHDVGEFLREANILRELEPFGPLGLQSMGVPDAVDHRVADALGLGHSSAAPMGASRGFRLKGGINDSLDALGGDRDTTATAWSDMGESVDATFLKASAPLNHRRAAGVQFCSDAVVRQPGGAHEHNLGPSHDALRGFLGANPSFENPLLVRGQRDGVGFFPHADSINQTPIIVKLLAIH